MSWKFDEERLDTYNNKVYLTQCNRQHKPIDNSGFVTPTLISDTPAENNDENNWEDSVEDIREENVEEKSTITFTAKKSSNNFSAVEKVMGMQEDTIKSVPEELSQEDIKKIVKFKL